VTDSQIFVGLGLTITLAVASQITADKLRLPAIVLLLPAGFVAGALVDEVDPIALFGDAFTPLVELSVAVVLFDGGLDLVFTELEGHSGRVVRRLIYLGVPITWAGAGAFGGLLLGLSIPASFMLGAILIVSGPTVVAPLLRLARPVRRVERILAWESTTIDPIGALIGALTFQAIRIRPADEVGRGVLAFTANVSVGLVGGAIGAAVLWVLLRKLRLSGPRATLGIVATVVAVAAFCNALRSSTGLVAAIVMGIALANLPGLDLPEDRPFFKTVVELLIGLLFVSISATVTPESVGDVLWPTLALVAVLVVIVRPLVAATATFRTNLPRKERVFIAWMDPRGIVAASTAATFSAQLVHEDVAGAGKLLPATFIVIVCTVSLYGLTAAPLARRLGLTASQEPDDERPAVSRRPRRAGGSEP
jgi:NhaP-type Na+/H+ or K+/H+ antiporter